MLKIKGIKFKKTKQFLGNLPTFLAERSFLTFCALLIISIILSGLIFYQYSTLANKRNLDVTEKTLLFQGGLYKNILQTWKDKKEKFDGADAAEYPNLFLPPEISGEARNLPK